MGNLVAVPDQKNYTCVFPGQDFVAQGVCPFPYVPTTAPASATPANCQQTAAAYLGAHYIAFSVVLGLLTFSIAAVATWRIRGFRIAMMRERQPWYHRLDAQVHVCVLLTALMLLLQSIDFQSLAGRLPEYVTTISRDIAVASAMTGVLLVLRRWLSIVVQATTMARPSYAVWVRAAIGVQWSCLIVLDIIEFAVAPPDVQRIGGRSHYAVGTKFVILCVLFVCASVVSAIWGTRIYLELQKLDVPLAGRATAPSVVSTTNPLSPRTQLGVSGRSSNSTPMSPKSSKGKALVPAADSSSRQTTPLRASATNTTPPQDVEAQATPTPASPPALPSTNALSSLGFLADLLPTMAMEPSSRSERSDSTASTRKFCGCSCLKPLGRRQRSVLQSTIVFTILPLITAAYDVVEGYREFNGCPFKVTPPPTVLSFYAQFSVYLLLAACVVALWLFSPSSGKKAARRSVEFTTANPAASVSFRVGIE